MKPWNALFLVASLDLFAAGMLTIQMQGHLRSMGANHLELGFVGSIYSFVQFFSGPVVGRWSDRVGRKRALLACLLACAVGYLLLGRASTLWLYACIRFYLGLFKHTLNTTKSYLAEASTSMSHTELFGKYNAYCQLAFILGGPVSGHLMEQPEGFSKISAITALLFLVNAGFVQTLLSSEPDLKKKKKKSDPDIKKLTDDVNASCAGGGGRASRTDGDVSTAAVTVGARRRADGDQTDAEGHHPLGYSGDKGAAAAAARTFSRSLQVVDWGNLWDVFLVRFLLGLSALVYRDCVVLVLRDVYALSPRYVGYISSYTAFVGMASGFAIRWLARLLGGGGSGSATVLVRASLAQCVALFGLLVCCCCSGAGSSLGGEAEPLQQQGQYGLGIPVLLASLLLLSAGGGVTKATSASLTLERGGDENAGLLIGVAASVLSVSRLVAPLASGALMHFVGPIAPLLACLVLTGAAAVLLLLLQQQQKLLVRLTCLGRPRGSLGISMPGAAKLKAS